MLKIDSKKPERLLAIRLLSHGGILKDLAKSLIRSPEWEDLYKRNPKQADEDPMQCAMRKLWNMITNTLHKYIIFYIDGRRYEKVRSNHRKHPDAIIETKGLR